MTLTEMCGAIIKAEEGFRSKPYYCSEGYPTVGYGKVIGSKGDPLPNIEVNQNAEGAWLFTEINKVIGLVSNRHHVAWSKCNDARRAILVSMCYQLGLTGMSNFKMMLSSICEEDFNSAALHMLDSRWNKQTPNRAARHAEQMQAGKMMRYYL
jgi:lysozyme